MIEVIAQLHTQAEQKQIDLQFDMDDNANLQVECNPERLQQVMNNLISNAIKYTPEQGKVHVKLFTQDNNLLFQVSDTGPGIPQNDQPHIFDKF